MRGASRRGLGGIPPYPRQDPPLPPLRFPWIVMHRRRSVLVTVGRLLLGGCSAPQLAVEPSFGLLEVSGEVAIGDEGVQLVDNSMSDLGLEGEEPSVGLRADFKWGVPHLTFATQSAEWSGSVRATDLGDISGNDVAVDSRVDLHRHRALVTLGIVKSGSSQESVRPRDGGINA